MNSLELQIYVSDNTMIKYLDQFRWGSLTGDRTCVLRLVVLVCRRSDGSARGNFSLQDSGVVPHKHTTSQVKMRRLARGAKEPKFTDKYGHSGIR